MPNGVITALLGDPSDPTDSGKVRILAENPEIGKQLGGPLRGFQRLPVMGRYRAIYRVFPQRSVVAIVLVGVRRQGSSSDAYERMQRLLDRHSLPVILGPAGKDLFR